MFDVGLSISVFGISHPISHIVVTQEIVFSYYNFALQALVCWSFAADDVHQTKEES
jgi:hypothetical protein